MDELVAVRLRDGRTAIARAVIHRHGLPRRVVSGVVCVAAGLVVAVLLLPVPGLHLFSTWMFPLLGIVVGGYLATKPGDVVSVAASCPACGAAITLPGGPIEASMWRACPGCAVPLELRV